MFLYSLAFFVIGLFFGSFLGVVVDRLPEGESIWKGRSHCDHCKKNLEWYELIPLVSFFLQNGKCRKCKAKLSWKYPLIELLTGLLFVLIFFYLGGMNQEAGIMGYIQTVYYLFITSCLIIIFFTDLEYGIIPDAIILPSVIISLIYFFLIHDSLFLIRIYSAIGAFLFFLFLFFVTRGRGMGLGDVKFALLMGLLLGFPNIVIALYIAFLTGALVSIILMMGRKVNMKSAVPFGPFLVFGTFGALFFGKEILRFFIH